MKNAVFPSHRKLALRFAAAILSFSACAPLAAQGTNLVEEARILLEQDRYVEALAAAKDAVRLDMNDYRAHYYVAMAYLGLQEFESADAEATAALALAPSGDRAAVQRLVDTIRSLQQGNQDVSEADAALAEGLIGKAARLYEEAWGAGYNAPDFAFKAADLYSTRLSQPVDAARVLRQVQRSLPGSVSSDKATAELKKIGGTLRQIATARVNEARGRSWAEAAPRLQAAEDADPDYAEIYKLRAQIAAASGTTGQLEDAIKELARRNLIDLDDLAALAGMDARMNQPSFEQFVSDVIGANQAASLKFSASPAGRVAYLSKLAGQGKISFFMGGRRVSGTNSFRTWSRRNVSSFRSGAECAVTVGLGGTIGSSSDMYSYSPSAVVVDVKRMTAAPVLNGTSVDLGRTSNEWEMTAIGIPDGGVLAQRTYDAMLQVYNACPRPAPKRR